MFQEIKCWKDKLKMSTFLSNDKFGRENYTGEWRFGMITGMGKMVWKSGAMYSGAPWLFFLKCFYSGLYKYLYRE